MSDNSRRKFLQQYLMVMAIPVIPSIISIPASAATMPPAENLEDKRRRMIKQRRKAKEGGSFDWAEMDKLRKKIIAPTFPNRDFLITEFGAKANHDNGSTHTNSTAIKSAIEACHNAGGGRVVIKGGVFKSAAIHLKSNVNLHIEKGATIAFSTTFDDYLPVVFTRLGGTECMTRSPLIYAYQQTNIAITGEGVLDGMASEDNWWGFVGADPEKGSDSGKILEQMAIDNVPVSQRIFEKNHFFRPPFIQPYECENVLIEGVTLHRGPAWMINPVLCKNVTVNKVTIDSWGYNNDGCDPESCENVLIEHCDFTCKDDGVAIKSGRNADGRRVNVPSRNIIVANCVMNTRHTAVAIGSEMTGGVENVYIENITGGKIQRAFRIKTNSLRGGFARNIGFRNSTVKEATGVLIDIKTSYGREIGEFYPEITNINIENVACKHAVKAISMMGTADIPINNVALKNIKVDKSEDKSVFNHVTGFTFEKISIDFG
jgi:polygalacturonase